MAAAGQDDTWYEIFCRVKNKFKNYLKLYVYQDSSTHDEDFLVKAQWLDYLK